MSSNIEVQRVCQFCGEEFTARKTVTQYCSVKCAGRAYKERQKQSKIEESNRETNKIKNKAVEDLKVKEYLTVREAATLLSCSVRSIYYYIEHGIIKAGNPSKRMTRIRRSEIDRLFF